MSLKGFFWIMGIVLMTFPLFVTAIDVYDRIKYKNYKSVRVNFWLVVICCLSEPVALMGALGNTMYMIEDKYTDNLWFIVMMFLIYVGMFIILIEIHSERIIYLINGDDVFISRFLYEEPIKIKIKEITRIHLSDEYLDIYIGDKRIRYGNNFITGAVDFERFVKHYNMN